MADEELSQIDDLAEQDVLDALGEKSEKKDDEILIEDYTDESSLEAQTNEAIDEDENKEDNESSVEEPVQEIPETQTPSTTNLEVSSSDISTLLTQLLQNKTLEITIKIKE